MACTARQEYTIILSNHIRDRAGFLEVARSLNAIELAAQRWYDATSISADYSCSIQQARYLQGDAWSVLWLAGMLPVSVQSTFPTSSENKGWRTAFLNTFLGCAMHSTPTGYRGGYVNAYNDLGWQADSDKQVSVLSSLVSLVGIHRPQMDWELGETRATSPKSIGTVHASIHFATASPLLRNLKISNPSFTP